MTLDEKLFNDVITEALSIMRFSAGKRASVLRKLQAMAKELSGLIVAGDIAAANEADVKKFLSEVEKLVFTYYRGTQGELELEGLSRTVAEANAQSLKIAIGVQAVRLPRQSYFASLASDVLIQGAPSADWWRGQEQGFAFKFAQQLRLGLANQETNQQLVARIVGKGGEPGIIEIAKREAAALVNTSVQTVANDARRKTWQANSNLIKGIQQVSTLDGHTSDICIAYSGAKWDLDYKPIGNSPAYNGGTPRHFNCRSVETPITKTFRELGLNVDEVPVSTRASDEGQIAANTTFETFLSGKPQAYQDKLLGPGRADLWRAGKITLRDLVSGDGRPLTLDELRRKAGLD